MMFDKSGEVERGKIVHVHDEKVIGRYPNCPCCTDSAEGVLLNKYFQFSATRVRDSVTATSGKCQEGSFGSADRQEYFPNIVGEECEYVAF